MLINAPVYSNENNTHFVNIYSETEDGTFKRTMDEPLRLLRDDIAGISMTQGELISSFYDRADRRWSTATVTYFYGKPQSYYQFLRDMIARNKFFVFSKPVLSGHLYKFDIHELKLKPSMSQRKISILKEKYIESIDLWSQSEHDARLATTEKTGLVRVAHTGRRHAVNDQKPTQKDKIDEDFIDFDTVSPSTRANFDKADPSMKVIEFKRVSPKKPTERFSRTGSHSLDSETKIKPGKPGSEKSGFRHAHFLRRFIFDRR